MRRTVISYLNRYTGNGSRGQVIDCFMNDCSARLALDLCQRFHPAEMMYCEDANHFGACIGGRVYDITGDVTDRYQWGAWSAFASREPERAAEIYRDRVLLEPVLWGAQA